MVALPSLYSTLAVPYALAAMGVPRKLRSDFRPSSYENIEIWLRTSELAMACDCVTFWASACAATREMMDERTTTDGRFMAALLWPTRSTLDPPIEPHHRTLVAHGASGLLCGLHAARGTTTASFC